MIGFLKGNKGHPSGVLPQAQAGLYILGKPHVGIASLIQGLQVTIRVDGNYLNLLHCCQEGSKSLTVSQQSCKHPGATFADRSLFFDLGPAGWSLGRGFATSPRMKVLLSEFSAFRSVNYHARPMGGGCRSGGVMMGGGCSGVGWGGGLIVGGALILL